MHRLLQPRFVALLVLLTLLLSILPIARNLPSQTPTWIRRAIPEGLPGWTEVIFLFPILLLFYAFVDSALYYYTPRGHIAVLAKAGQKHRWFEPNTKELIWPWDRPLILQAELGSKRLSIKLENLMSTDLMTIECQFLFWFGFDPQKAAQDKIIMGIRMWNDGTMENSITLILREEASAFISGKSFKEALVPKGREALKKKLGQSVAKFGRPYGIVVNVVDCMSIQLMSPPDEVRRALAASYTSRFYINLIP